MKTLITLFSEKVNGVDVPTVAGVVRRHLSPRFRFTEKSQEGTTTFQIEDIEDKGNPMGAIEVHRLLDQCLLRAVKWHYVGTGLEPEPKKSELEELNRLYDEALRNAYLHVRDAIGKELDLLGHIPPDSPAHPAPQPPKTQAEKEAAVKNWDALPKNIRPPLFDWLCQQFGINADGTPAVNETTFQGWRRYLKGN